MAQFIPFTPEEQEEYKKKAGLLPSTGVVEPPEPKRATGSFVPLEPEERKGILADRLVLAAREGYEEQPEDYARRLQLARSNGWPEWMVSDPEIRKEAELNELGRKLTELPEDYSRTSSALGIPRNFTLFRDDIETLKGVEDAVKGASAVTPMGRATVAFDEPEKDLVAEFFRHSGKGFANVMELHRYAELSAKERTEGLADEEQAEWDALQSRLVPEEAPTLWEQVQQGAGSSLAFQGRPLSRFLSRWGIPLALATAGAAALAGTGGTAAPLIGALTPAAKALALGGAIGATGYRVQSFMDYQGLATELSYRTLSQMTDDRGVPYAEILGEGTISRLARGIGLAASTMEFVGLEAVLGMVPGIGSLIPAKGMTRSVLMQPTIQKAILTGLANAFRTWSVEVGTEVAEQAVTTGGEEFAKWMVEQSGGRVSYADAGEWAARLGEEAVGAGASFLLGVGVGPGMMNVAGNVAQVNAAKRAQGTFLTLVELAEQSRGFKRSPDDGASVVSGIVAGSPVETTYVAARQFVEAYQQLGVDPAAVAESLGVSRESLAEALETEGRIAVPTGEWTAKVAGTEAGRALLGDLTFESDGMTLREAQLAERELTELMRREAKAAEEAFKADEVLNQELESVRTDFLTQATGAGLDAETAQADAEVWAAFARTAYRRFGIRPREFSDMVGLEIRRGQEAAAGEGYSQVDAKILDGRYFAAVEAGDMEAAQAIVDEAARAAGYGSGEDYRMQHRAPNREDYRLAGIRESDLVPGDYWTHPEWYQGSSEEQEAFRAVLAALERDEARRGRGRTPGLTALTVYRAVPKGVKEGSFRNGDWVTPSRAYAELEGAGIRGGFRIIEKRVPLKDLWWDGNSIAELGYDDGESYVYRDTRNNRKLSGPVVRDMEGNVVPPSRRFKPRKAETFYQTAFHGSPYRFSRFSLDHVGEGEGAQAYGWGLYFAGNKEVAEHYRQGLAGQVIEVDGKDYFASMTWLSPQAKRFAVLEISNAVHSGAEDAVATATNALTKQAQNAKNEQDRRVLYDANNALLGLMGKDFQLTKGQLYEVDIPNDDVLLDWDKPLSEQGSLGERAWQAILARFGDDERLQEAFRFETMSPEEYKTYLVHEGYGSRRGWELRDGSVYRGDGEVVPEAAVAEQMKKDKGSKVFPSFGALYQTLSDTLGSQQEASRFLADAADIRGIKYLDGTSRSKGEGSYNYVIFDDAAIDVLETFYQQARGQAAFPSGQSIVTLFETADRSTLLHEMGHVFLNGLGLMAQRNEAAATEWAVVMDFLGVDDWDALTPEERTEAHETFARAFEAYLMEGKAPSTALQRAFRMFKSWLIDIYRNLMGLSRQAGRDVALSDEARDIFSRLLATDEEIAEAAALAPFLAAVEATDESRELHREATAQAAEEAGRIRSAAEMRARRKELAAQIRQELEASRGYRALFAMQRSADKGGRKINEDEFIERYGEMAWSESARPLGITSKRSTWALDDLALSLGYLTADEMVEEVLALPPLKDALAAQVDLVMAQEAQQEALSAEAALRNDARLAALILEHDSLAGGGTDVPRDAVDAPAWVQLLEEVEAEEQNPLSRENLLAEIRERGGIRYESIKALWGPGEAKTLRERLGPGLFRKDGRGLDQLVNELRADGVPVESTQALYDILLEEGGPQRQELDVAVDAESLPWLVWMLGRDETRDYLGKRRRTVRKALKEATDAFEADRSDEARQARVAAQRELDYIDAALTELGKDVDPDARYRVDFDPATLGQPREGRATWSQPTVREALAEQMKGTDPVKMRDAWALASRIARSAVGESRKQAREAQKALREQVREVARARQAFQAQQRATVRARVEAARVSARKVLENRKASEVNPREFIRAEREAARNVERALKDNNFDEAARQKDIEIINAALAYEAGRTKLEVGKIRAYLDKMAKRRKPGTLGADYLDRIHAVLEGVAFKKTRSRKAEQELAGFLEWKKEQESLGEVVAVPDRLVEQMGRVRFDSLTVGELREIHDSVRNLEHLGRTKTRLLTDRRKRDFETAVGDLLKSVDENLGAPYKTDLTPDKTLGQKAASALRAADAMHRRMEFLLRKLDGNRDLGTAWDLIFRPIVDAERAEIVLREEAAQRLQALFERLGKVNLQSKRFYREVDMRLSKENLLAIALNMGNEGNRDRLLSGHGWSEAQVMGLLQHLSRGEWEWVQGVWDFLDSFWPQVAALEKEMAGVEPRRVERMPFVARGSDGSEIELSGGYYPIAYDASKSPQAFEIEEKRHVQDAMATQSYRAATRHGHTKARAGHAEIPLSLNLSTISRHVQEVVHDLTHRKAVRDVGRILEDRRVQKAITEALGAEYWREFKPWLKHVAAGRDATPLNAWEQFLSHTRQGVTIATLGAKATTAIMQVMSIFGAAERIGALHMMNSIQEFYRNPAAWREKTQFVYDRSPEIRNRRRNWDRDVRDTLARNVGKGKKARVLEMAFWAAGMMDAAAVVPTWREAYQMKLAETGSEETAIHFADSVVRQTQPANRPKDLASVMRGHETRKLFTMFYSYWSVFYNLAASRIGATKRIGDLPRLAGSFLFMVAVPAVLGPLLTRRGPDDDEDPLGWAAKQMLLFPFNALIGMRDVVSYVANPQWGYRLTPASRGFESAGNLVVQAKQALFDGDDWEDVIRPAVDLIGIWGHLPTDQARVTIGQFLRYLAGDMPDYDVADLFFRHRQ